MWSVVTWLGHCVAIACWVEVRREHSPVFSQPCGLPCFRGLLRSNLLLYFSQCEECQCWQHGVCMGLLEENVPEKYTCYVCQDPPGRACWSWDVSSV